MASSIPSEEDVATAVKNKLGNATGYAAAVPGGVHYMRRPAGKAFPYVVLTVEAGERQDVESDGGYSQPFKVTATAWAKGNDTTAANTSTLRSFLDTNLGGGASSPAGGLTVPNAIAVTAARRVSGKLTLSPELRAGQDVLATAAILEVMVEGKQE